MNKQCVNVTTVYKSKCNDVCPTDQVCSEEGKCVCIDGNNDNCSFPWLNHGPSSGDNGNKSLSNQINVFK